MPPPMTLATRDKSRSTGFVIQTNRFEGKKTVSVASRAPANMHVETMTHSLFLVQRIMMAEGKKEAYLVVKYAAQLTCKQQGLVFILP